jgi:hypothetical protein
MRTQAVMAGAALLVAGIAAGAAAPRAVAQPNAGEGEERSIALTVYNNDLGLVKDVRRRTLARGASELSFADVAEQIDPTSVHLRATGGKGGFDVLEQNYRFDLASADAILNRYLGREIEVVDKQGELYSGTLLSQDGGHLVIRKTGDDGGLAIIRREEVVRMQFPELPQGLVVRPTLVWSLQSDGGEHNLELEYLTGGISWHAEYVGVVAPKGDKLQLSAWVSIDNRSGTTYPNAKLKLVAGDVHRVQETPKVARGGRAPEMMAMDTGFQEKPFFEYHLYTLGRPATVADNEIKQISLFEPAEAHAVRGYEYDGAMRPDDVQVILKVKNSEKEGLGMPLPAGKVRVYQEDDDGSLEFVGEDRVDHTPRDEEVRLVLGNAFDIAAERNVMQHERISTNVYEETVEVKIRNHKKEAVTVTVIEHLYGFWEIRESTHGYRRKDARTAEFDVKAAPDQEILLRYKVRVTR